MQAFDKSLGLPAILTAFVDREGSLAPLEEWLPPMLSVIAGMVDLTGFFTLGNIFTAHVTGNLVLAAATLVYGGPVKWAQLLAIPIFMASLSVVWWVAKESSRREAALARLLLLIQLGLLVATLVFSVLTKPSTQPHGIVAGITAMIAVAAMASQYALLRLSIPGAVSTAVMTGNLTSTVLLSMDALFGQALTVEERRRLRRSALLLLGFLCGCLVAAGAIALLADWAWIVPVLLGALVLALVPRAPQRPQNPIGK